MKQLDFTFY